MRLFLLAALVTASVTLMGQPLCARGICPQYQCYGPCGQGCVCLRQGAGPGECYGADLVPEMLGRGYRQVP